MNNDLVKQVRAFNRFYTNIIGLLDRHILNSEYSLPEVRILYELYFNSRLTASDIIAQIDIDKGYLSRIIKKFERTKMIHRVHSETDRRTIYLQLSTKGKKEFEVLNKASDSQIQGLLKTLSRREANELTQRMADIRKLLTKSLKK